MNSKGNGPGPAREVHLVRRPAGIPDASDFRIVDAPVGQPGADELLVRNRWLSVDPYMRLRMDGAESYITPFDLGQVIEGEAVGEILESNSERFSPGEWVMHGLGWRELSVVPAREARSVDTGRAPASSYLGVMGWPGYTAHVGLLDVAGLRDGDVVFVSAAAGAVGSLAGQIGRLKGHRVIGSAGSDEKVAHLIDDLGFDAGFNYRSGDVSEQLRQAAPEGIDVYFDNVGGDHLEAAIECMAEHGRVAMCGAIAGYNAMEPPCAPRNMFKVIAKRLRLEGFLIGEDAARWQRFSDEVGGCLERGEIIYRETVRDGIESAVGAFLDMLRGANTGKMLVRL